MSRWYINDVELTNTVVSSEKINMPWVNTAHEIYNKKSVVNSPARSAQPIVVDMSLRGANRFNLESSIRAELESSHTVMISCIGSNTYVDEDKTFVWVMPTGFNVKDEHNILRCSISGLIDERIIHSCDFLTNWSGTTGVSLSLSTAYYGQHSIKTTMTLSASTFDASYTPAQPCDLSVNTYLSFWLQSVLPSTSFSASRVILETATNNYFYWNTTYNANTWTYENLTLKGPAGTVGSPSLENITKITKRIISSITTTTPQYIDDMRVW